MEERKDYMKKLLSLFKNYTFFNSKPHIRLVISYISLMLLGIVRGVKSLFVSFCIACAFVVYNSFEFGFESLSLENILNYAMSVVIILEILVMIDMIASYIHSDGFQRSRIFEFITITVIFSLWNARNAYPGLISLFSGLFGSADAFICNFISLIVLQLLLEKIVDYTSPCYYYKVTVDDSCDNT